MKQDKYLVRPTKLTNLTFEDDEYIYYTHLIGKQIDDYITLCGESNDEYAEYKLFGSKEAKLDCPHCIQILNVCEGYIKERNKK